MCGVITAEMCPNLGHIPLPLNGFTARYFRVVKLANDLKNQLCFNALAQLVVQHFIVISVLVIQYPHGVGDDISFIVPQDLAHGFSVTGFCCNNGCV